MALLKTTLKLYTVVEVWRGIAKGATNFTCLADAETFAQRLRRRRNPQEDEITVFDSPVRRHQKEITARHSTMRRRNFFLPARSR